MFIMAAKKGPFSFMLSDIMAIRTDVMLEGLKKRLPEILGYKKKFAVADINHKPFLVVHMFSLLLSTRADFRKMVISLQNDFYYQEKIARMDIFQGSKIQKPGVNPYFGTTS